MPPRINPVGPMQMDLLAWEPTAATVEFAPDEVRGATIAARLSRAVSVTLREAKGSREKIAERMSRFLGERVSPHILNGYAAPSRSDHSISVVRLLGLMHATGDRRLLQMIADEMGWAVIEKRHLHLIEVAQLREHEDTLKSRRKALMAKVGTR